MRIQGDLASNLTTDWREQQGDIQVGTSSAGSDQSVDTSPILTWFIYPMRQTRFTSQPHNSIYHLFAINRIVKYNYLSSLIN